MSGKNPAFLFYPGDWIQDTRILTPLTRGIWIDMLCFMWRSPNRGKLEMTYQQYARLLSCTEQEIETAINELSVTCNANVTICNKIVTVINRRMYREESERISTRYRVANFRKRKSNGIVTPPSSVSVSVTKKKSIEKKILKTIIYSESFLKFYEVYPCKVSKQEAFNSWSKLNPDEELTNKIINAIIQQISLNMINTTELKYCPLPATWLNQRRWEDEVEQQEAPSRRDKENFI